jgi:hypothetical protein
MKEMVASVAYLGLIDHKIDKKDANEAKSSPDEEDL